MQSVVVLQIMSTSFALAQAATTAPRQLIDHLGVEIRTVLEDPKSSRTPEDVERVVAEQISELVRTAPGHPSLTETDNRGRTPLMLAASSAYPQVVQALLADASVKQAINETDGDSATAWMHANFAPSLTLMACEPATLTLERYTLLPPYLQRMSHLLKTKGAAIGSIVKMLKDAGAATDADETKRLWLARCPNASPELRETLGSRELMPALIGDSLARLKDFNRLAKDAPKSIPYKPPAGLRFTRAGHALKLTSNRSAGELAKVSCSGMSTDLVPDPSRWTRSMQQWSGTVHVKLQAATRAGVIETADLDVAPGPGGEHIAEDFTRYILQALANYRCDGDHVFEQEFELKIQ